VQIRRGPASVRPPPTAFEQLFERWLETEFTKWLETHWAIDVRRVRKPSSTLPGSSWCASAMALNALSLLSSFVNSALASIVR